MNNQSGSLEVVTGSMFSGKTEEIIRRLRRAKIARQQAQVFRPALDTRYGEGKVTSHAGAEFEATEINDSSVLSEHLDEATTVVALDEVQFFDEGVIEVVQLLADQGMRVIVGGLDTDFRGEPFGPMPDLMAQAERVDKLHAICMVCGQRGSRTQRLINGNPARYDDPVVVVGASEMYEARCREHHEVIRA